MVERQARDLEVQVRVPVQVQFFFWNLIIFKVPFRHVCLGGSVRIWWLGELIFITITGEASVWTRTLKTDYLDPKSVINLMYRIQNTLRPKSGRFNVSGPYYAHSHESSGLDSGKSTWPSLNGWFITRNMV